MEPDRITNLPDNVIEGILLHLPMRDAVRTSILSSKWRYKWATVPYLVFNGVFCPFYYPTDITSKIVSIIDRVLVLHFGVIHKFELSHGEFEAVSDIDRWILHLSRRSIENIVLEIWQSEAYKVPSCLFYCQSLTNLELYNCSLKPPSIFEGFRKLERLDIQNVTLEQDFLENLISSCPNLEILYLADIKGLSRMNVNAPKLRHFDFEGVLEDISFENTFNLVRVLISFHKNVKNDQCRALRNSSNLLKILVNLPTIKVLKLQEYSLKYLAVGIEPHKLPEPRVELKYISIYINLNNHEDSLTFLCLLSSAPNLDELEMTAHPEEQTIGGIDTNFWEDGCWNLPFSKLRVVKITGISGAKPEMDFIKFVLLNSPALERMVVEPVFTSDRWELVTKLLCFKRASNQAEIIYKNPQV